MGSVVSSIFGGATQSTSDIPVMPARENETEAEARGVRDEARRKIAARRGLSGTILSNPKDAAGLLGRTLPR